MDALVTGAAGFIGSHLTERLAAGGMRVRALARRGPHPVAAAHETVIGDVRNWRAVDDATRDVDTVYHLAAVTPGGGGELWATNVEGTELLMRACLRNGVRRVVFVSSVSVYSPPLGSVIGEEAATGGVDLYGRSKTAGEAIVRGLGGRDVEHVILRPCQVYGVSDRSGYTGRLAALAFRRFVPVARGAARFSLVHVDDLVDAIEAAGQQGRAAGGVFNIVGPTQTSIAELAQELAPAPPATRRMVPIPRAALRAGLAARWLLAAARSRNVRPFLRSYAGDTLHGSIWLGGPEYAGSRAREFLGFFPAVEPVAGLRSVIGGRAD